MSQELLPDLNCFRNRVDSRGTCQVIAAARWDDQHGNIRLGHLPKMSVHGAVATEDQDNIGTMNFYCVTNFFRLRRIENSELRVRVSKLLNLFVGSARTGDGERAHGLSSSPFCLGISGALWS